MNLSEKGEEILCKQLLKLERISCLFLCKCKMKKSDSPRSLRTWKSSLLFLKDRLLPLCCPLWRGNGHGKSADEFLQFVLLTMRGESHCSGEAEPYVPQSLTLCRLPVYDRFDRHGEHHLSLSYFFEVIKKECW